MTVDPLVSVRVLFRDRPGFSSLPHVVDTVSVFLDTSVELPLEKASRFGSLRLLNRIWNRLETLETPELSWSVFSEEESYKERQFSLSLIEAAKTRDLPMTKWLFDHFPERNVDVSVVEAAAAAGAMEILQYFYDNEFEPLDPRNRGVGIGLEFRDINWGGKDTVNAATGGYSDIVRWLYGFDSKVDRDDAGTMVAAMNKCDLQLVMWMNREMQIPIDGADSMDANYQIEMVDMLKNSFM